MTRSAVLVAVSLIACTDEAGQVHTVVDTLPSGTIVVRNGEPATGWRRGPWRLELIVKIGSAEAPPHEQFGAIADLMLDDDGNLYVLETRPPEIRVFDTRGAFLRSIGRAGQGPGELLRPYALALDSDGRIWVGDSGNHRYSLFTRDGEAVGTIRSPIRGGSARGQMRVVRDRLFDFERLMRREGGPSGAVHIRFMGDGMIELSVQDSLIPIDTIPLGEFTAMGLVQERGGTRTSIIPPFAIRRSFASAADGHVWVGTSDLYRIFEVRIGGDTVRSVHMEAETTRLDESDRAALREWYESYTELGFAGDPSALPDAYPHFDRIITSEDGTIWLQRSAPAPGFDVFDPGGVFIGFVPLEAKGLRDAGVHPFITEDNLALVLADALGVQNVLVFRIVRDPGA